MFQFTITKNPHIVRDFRQVTFLNSQTFPIPSPSTVAQVQVVLSGSKNWGVVWKLRGNTQNWWLEIANDLKFPLSNGQTLPNCVEATRFSQSKLLVRGWAKPTTLTYINIVWHYVIVNHPEIGDILSGFICDSWGMDLWWSTWIGFRVSGRNWMCFRDQI